jgi:putative transposase
MKHREISAVLGVRSSYISKWEKRYSEQGVEGLKLAYKGYLTSLEKTKIVEWIGEKSQRTLLEVVNYIEKEYNALKIKQKFEVNLAFF